MTSISKTKTIFDQPTPFASRRVLKTAPLAGLLQLSVYSSPLSLSIRRLGLLLAVLALTGFGQPIGFAQSNSDSASAARAQSGPPRSIPVFTDVTAAAGLDTSFSYAFGGPIWGDYDNDGYLDLYTDNHDHGAPFLYHNNGNGTFTNVVTTSGIHLAGDKHGSGWADFDNDGNLDLFQAYGGGDGHTLGTKMDELYQDLGTNTFVNIAEAAGVTDTLGRGRSVAWGDINDDGLPDLLLGDLKTNLVLYLNNGDGTFTDITAAAGLSNLHDIEAAFADYDKDGLVDIFVTNAQEGDQETDLLFHNNGDNTFTKVNTQAGIQPLLQGRSIAWGDYDNDGYLDLFVARGSDNGAMKQTLYHNNRDGTFTDVTDQAGLSALSNNREACWGDFDNDGFLDLYVVNSGSDPDGKGPNYLFHNNHNGTFTDVAATARVQVLVASRGRGAGWGDYDNDGFLDLFVTNGEDNTDFERGPKVLFHNGGNTNNWLKVVCVGTTSNRRGLGVKVTVQTGQTSQYREMNGASGHYLSQDAAPFHFGLGKFKQANVTVQWPSGTIDSISNVAAKTTLTVTE